MGLKDRFLEWYETNKRDLPWRKTNDPYHIWLSEIILQQTRIRQGLDYYLRFTENYPTVIHLADAPVDDILKLWQGLGYYNRARNMHQAAKTIAIEYNGVFPDTYDALLKLKGVGSYTAAAIASIAFNEPVPVVDGNVMRVFARLFGITDDIKKENTKRKIFEISKKYIDRKNPGIYNQAIMEFGALHCVAINPGCNFCLLKQDCSAYQNNKVHQLPFKSAGKKQKSRYFNYLVIRDNERIIVEQRLEKDIWYGLYQFPVIETGKRISINELIRHESWVKWFGENKVHVSAVAKEYKHILSHQIIYARFVELNVSCKENHYPTTWKSIEINDIDKYAVSRLMEKFLNQQLGV